MTATSVAEYVFIRTSICFLHHVALISILYCLLLLPYPFLPRIIHPYHAPFLLEAWFLAETVFFIVYLPYYSYLQQSAIHPESLSREERGRLFERCNNNVTDPEKYLSQWFLGAKRQHIKRENLKEFITWAFFNTDQAKAENEEELDDYVKATEKLLGRELSPGRGSAKSLRLTLGEVDCLHRSLLWYLCVSTVDVVLYCSMLTIGFHFHRTSLGRFFALFPFRPLTLLSTYRSPVQNLTYWHRPHTSNVRLPVLFIHGIGIGLYPYANFLRLLNEAKMLEGDDVEVGIIALELMSVSSRITHPALEKDVMVREIQLIAEHHGWNKFILVSHSYGSIISTHLLKSSLTGPLIGPVVLIDPVSLLLHLPDVAYNFTARQPSSAKEHLLWYFGSKDIGVAHALARRFFWSENIIWKEELSVEGEQGGAGRNVTVVLSGRDLIVDAEAVGQYLTASPSKESGADAQVVETTKRDDGTAFTQTVNQGTGEWKRRSWTGYGLEVIWHEHLDHAQVFDCPKMMAPLIKAIRVYSVKG
ncbi:MAG: hypothetical protein M1838_001518 [Thelocarpon superellum]|nr:MAG: hypothetical protein M1838_001518 [Thelocarpon superellum]